jgi:hypothetical protein
MSVITDEVYNNLQWELATMAQLKAIIQGATVLEADAIDEPFIDGVDLIIKGTDGRLRVVSFNADIDNFMNIYDVVQSHRDLEQHKQYMRMEELELEAIEASPLYIAIALIPEG